MLDVLDDLVRQLFALGLRLGYLGKRPWGYPVYIVTKFLGRLMQTYRVFLKIQEGPDAYSEYTDAYFFGERSGGGFENVVLDAGDAKRTFMRLYAGAVLDKESLKKFGITPEDVITFLKWVLLGAGGRTRLDQPFDKRSEDVKWEYRYNCGNESGFYSETFGVPLFSATETILFRADDGQWHNVLTHLFTFVEVK